MRKTVYYNTQTSSTSQQYGSSKCQTCHLMCDGEEMFNADHFNIDIFKFMVYKH